MCQGKSVKNPNRCRKMKGCKVATGTKRSFCRKSKNASKKTTMKKRKTAKRRPDYARLKGLNNAQLRTLKQLS